MNRLSCFSDVRLPIGYFVAASDDERIDALYARADDPSTSRADSEYLLSIIAQLRK